LHAPSYTANRSTPPPPPEANKPSRAEREKIEALLAKSREFQLLAQEALGHVTARTSNPSDSDTAEERAITTQLKEIARQFEQQALERQSLALQLIIFGDSGAGAEFSHVSASSPSPMKSSQESAYAFDVPAALDTNAKTTITYSLNLADSIDTLTPWLSARSPQQSAAAPISHGIKATLSGDGFIIDSITPTAQPLTSLHNAEWKWSVIPTSVGPHTLYLTLSSTLAFGSDSSERVIRTLKKSVSVEASGTHTL
jgi:hypothetical protein